VIIPFVDVLRIVSLRIVTMPIQSQGIITRDNVSVDVSAVAWRAATRRLPRPPPWADPHPPTYSRGRTGRMNHPEERQ
jgi:hypothetical protein